MFQPSIEIVRDVFNVEVAAEDRRIEVLSLTLCTIVPEIIPSDLTS